MNAAMIDSECPREQEVAELAASGRWGAGVPDDLAAHVASCDNCRDLAEIAEVVHHEYERAHTSAQVPPAGLVWWRAELRARREVAERAGRPITYVQAVAGSVAACLLFTLGGLLWPWFRASATFVDQLTAAADLGQPWVPFVLAVGAWLVLAPVLLVLALSDD